MVEQQIKLVKQLIAIKEDELQAWRKWTSSGNVLTISDNKSVYKALLNDDITELMTEEEYGLYNLYKLLDTDDVMYKDNSSKNILYTEQIKNILYELNDCLYDYSIRFLGNERIIITSKKVDMLFYRDYKGIVHLDHIASYELRKKIEEQREYIEKNTGQSIYTKERRIIDYQTLVYIVYFYGTSEETENEEEQKEDALLFKKRYSIDNSSAITEIIKQVFGEEALKESIKCKY